MEYYISRELVLLTICIMYSIVIIIYPVISAHYSSGFFTRALETSDIILGGGLIFGNGLLGMAVGDFFHLPSSYYKNAKKCRAVFNAVNCGCDM